MDDDDVQETGVLGGEESTTPGTAGAATQAAAAEEAPPPRPPRPVSDAQKNEQILKEAFPSIDAGIIKAVLTASGGRIDPAFNALLQMTDPSAAEPEHEVPPPPPPRPSAQAAGPTSTAQSQLEADEMYARQLAEQYENVGAYEDRTSSNRGMPRGRQQTGLNPNELHDNDHSFLDDDLPVIRENLRKGFVETQTKVNSWFNDLKKRINDQFDEQHEDDDENHQGGAGNSSFMGRPTRDQSRRTNDYDRYDADPELLSDDFAGMRFNPDGSTLNPYILILLLGLFPLSSPSRSFTGTNVEDPRPREPTPDWKQQPQPIPASYDYQVSQAQRWPQGRVQRERRGYRRLQRLAQGSSQGLARFRC